MSRRLGGVAGLAVALLLSGCSSSGTHAAVRPAAAPAATGRAAPADRLVWVSGRDDHGMVAEESVAVYDGPQGRHPVGRVPDGTLAKVVGEDGQWLRIRTLEGRHRVTGWVDDFFLRGQVRLVGDTHGCAVVLAGQRRDGGTLVVVRELRRQRARVELVTEPSVRGWVPRTALQELPPQGAHCGDVPPDDRHAHTH